MGQAMTSETLSISGEDGHRYWVGLQAKPTRRGCKKTIYKGVLLGCGPRQWEKVVAKSFTDIPGTKESWRHEVKKADLTKQLAATFSGKCPSEYKIRVVIPGLVQMDKVSKVNRWLEQRHGHRSLDKDDWISVEEHIPGRVYRFCPWSEQHENDDEDIMPSDHLQTFSHFTYMESNGELVACDFQGTVEDDIFIFTDSVVHSRLGSYGTFDAGNFGITEFFKRHRCTQVCKDWPLPTPLTPPPPFKDNNKATKHVRFDLTPFENVVFPSYKTKHKAKAKDKKHKGKSSKHSHGSGHDGRESRERLEIEAKEWHAQRCDNQNDHKTIYPSLSLPELDDPPAYSQTDTSRPRRLSDNIYTLVTSISLDEGSRSHKSSVCGKIQKVSPEFQAAPRHSCLKRNFSDQQPMISTKEFVLPSSRDSGTEKDSNSGNSHSDSKSSQAGVSFRLQSYEEDDESEMAMESPENSSGNQKLVGPQSDLLCGLSHLQQNTQTLLSTSQIKHKDNKSPVDSLPGLSATSQNQSTSSTNTSLIERRLCKGGNSQDDSQFAKVNELKIELPPLEPTAPPLTPNQSPK